MTGLASDWPVAFAPDVRAEVIARDTPAGFGRPVCVVCGEPVTGAVIHVHHRLYRSRGGDGRYSNGIVVHGEEQGPGCHVTAIHNEPNAGWRCAECGWQAARWAGRCGRCQAWGTVECESPSASAQGWAISRHAAAPGCYRMPLLCAWRGWIVLTDAPCADGRYWRPATPRDMAGDYGG